MSPMHRLPAGFTLLEVLLALLLITIGLLGFAGTLGPVATLAGEGRIRGREALLMASRTGRLRAELLSGAPACRAPAAGYQEHSSGIRESWTATLDSPLVEIRIAVSVPRSRGRPVDTLITRVPCP